MTDLLQQAIAQLRQMPDEMQDSVALALISRLEEDSDRASDAQLDAK
jgi:hypothetical protein